MAHSCAESKLTAVIVQRGDLFGCVMSTVNKEEGLGLLSENRQDFPLRDRFCSLISVGTLRPPLTQSQRLSP